MEGKNVLAGIFSTKVTWFLPNQVRLHASHEARGGVRIRRVLLGRLDKNILTAWIIRVLFFVAQAVCLYVTFSRRPDTILVSNLPSSDPPLLLSYLMDM